LFATASAEAAFSNNNKPAATWDMGKRWDGNLTLATPGGDTDYPDTGYPIDSDTYYPNVTTLATGYI